MDYELPRHEKIRFRREDIADLNALPSAAELHPDLAYRPLLPRLVRASFRFVAGLALACVVLLGAAYAFASWTLGSAGMRQEAEKAIEAAAGSGVQASIGPARLRLGLSDLLAVEIDGVSLRNRATGDVVVEAGSVRLGLGVTPLLSGRLQLKSARLTDARILPAAMPAGDKSDWLAPFRDPRGLVDSGKVAEAAFKGLHAAFDKVRSGTARRIALDNVEIVLPQAGEVHTVKVADASMTEAEPGRLTFLADLSLDDRPITLEGEAVREGVSGRIETLSIVATVAAGEAEPTAVVEVASEVPAGSRLGAAEFRIGGVEGAAGQPSTLSIAFTAKDSQIDLGARGVLAGEVGIMASISTAADTVEIERLAVRTGRSAFAFNGAVGPMPASEPGSAPLYRYEFISNETLLAPLDSPEPGLRFATRIAGTYNAASRTLKADNIGIRTGAGNAVGSATLEFVPGKTPGMALAFAVNDMPVAQVKQLWPWFSARGARNWVLGKFFGGTVTEGRIQFNFPPGRWGKPLPMAPEEISGRFDVSGSRFDTAGLIPPVRDAVGTVEFRGVDVDIALKSGTVYLPSGRTVAASNGIMRITKANVPPVIGDLDMDVSGDADAVTELASYEPINAMRHIGLAADDFSGKVSGHVKADIPLQRGIDSATLDWLVKLKYENLAVAKPLDGQVVTDAAGTISVDPLKAVIDAKGKLNGIPAEIAMIQPLKPAGPERQRKVALIIDDKTREAVLPALSTMVSGTMKVAVDSPAAGVRDIEADLTAAKLDIPWAGWSKGSGIAAKATFSMKSSGNTTTLSDFELSGKSFSISGDVTLAGGSLSAARFDSVKLNRDDEVAVSVKRTGRGGYTVDVSGASLDARSLVKQFTAGADAAAKSTGTAGTSVAVTGNVKAVSGFGGERLSNVKLDYAGAGARVDNLQISATAQSGAPISISNTTEGDRRSLQVKSTDAGAVLRFLDIYEHMQGGGLNIALTGTGDGPLKGQVDARNFHVVNEPKLASIVSTAPAGGDRSLNQAVRRDIDTSRVQFERGFVNIEKGPGYLKVSDGVLRGPLIGSTFQGTLYDKAGNMAMTGTFMPAYGLNRIFGELPLIGVILGNGNDRGLIGVTYKLSGDVKSPTLHVNPLSAIAPGIFRTIFEYQ